MLNVYQSFNIVVWPTVFQVAPLLADGSHRYTHRPTPASKRGNKSSRSWPLKPSSDARYWRRQRRRLTASRLHHPKTPSMTEVGGDRFASLPVTFMFERLIILAFLAIILVYNGKHLGFGSNWQKKKKQKKFLSFFHLIDSSVEASSKPSNSDVNQRFVHEM